MTFRPGFPMQQNKTSSRGFTLIEVLVTMAIVTILTTIALPSYLEHIARTRRADARTQLLAASQFMQRFYTANDSFATDRTGVGVALAVPQALRQSPPDGDALYALSIPDAGLTATRYELRMEPIAGGAMAKDKCGTFTLTVDGRRGVLVNGTEGASDLVQQCWK